MERKNVQQRVQLAILRGINDQRSVGWPTMSVICPRSDERDYTRALQLLFHDGAVEAPQARQDLRALAAAGHLRLTKSGQKRLDDA
jgi:hypothetical protein